MKGGRNRHHGFTVVEVLIVLAVTSALFLSATALISGKQNQTSFDQAIQEVRSQIQQVIGDVSNGYYPNLTDFQCSAGASGPVITTGGTTQGANTGCIFVGKALQFGVSGTNPEQFNTYSLAGLQQNTGGNDVSTLAEAVPTVIPSSTVSSQLENGLTTYKPKTMIVGGAAVGTIAFVSSLAPASGSSTSSSQQVNMVAVPGTAVGDAQSAAISAINTKLSTVKTTDASFNPITGIQICFVSGSTNQSGLITIGGTNSAVSATLAIKEDKTC